MMKLEGVYSVLATPFLSDFQIDLESLRRLIDLFLKAGVNGFTALGVTSETARLSEKERSLILQTTLAHVNGRVPVVVGTTAEGTQLCIEYSKEAVAAGASAVMVSPPRLPRLNTDAVVRHFQSLADAVDIPIVIQDYPPISGYSMEPALLVRLAKEIPNANTIKLEDPPTPFKTGRILEQSEGTSIRIFGGLGAVYLLEELIAGATGAMTGFAYPEILLKVIRSYQSGDKEKAADIFYHYVPLMRFEFQEGIGLAIRKELLHRRGAFSHATLRMPGAALDAATKQALDLLLSWLKM